MMSQSGYYPITMRPLLCSILLITFCITTVPALASERIIHEWNFKKATDDLGWNVAEPIDRFKLWGGALVANSSDKQVKLESPVFDLDSMAWQYVEIELRTDTDGTAFLNYTDTTQGPNHGFRPGQRHLRRRGRR